MMELDQKALEAARLAVCDADPYCSDAEAISETAIRAYLASLPPDDEVGAIVADISDAICDSYEKDGDGYYDTSVTHVLRRCSALLQSQAAELAAMNEALTPSGATKAEYIGEFFEQVEIRNPDFDDDDDAPETIMQHVPVSWTTIKAIMAALARRAHSKDGGEHV